MSCCASPVQAHNHMSFGAFDWQNIRCQKLSSRHILSKQQWSSSQATNSIIVICVCTFFDQWMITVCYCYIRFLRAFKTVVFFGHYNHLETWNVGRAPPIKKPNCKRSWRFPLQESSFNGKFQHWSWFKRFVSLFQKQNCNKAERVN